MNDVMVTEYYDKNNGGLIFSENSNISINRSQFLLCRSFTHGGVIFYNINENANK